MFATSSKGSLSEKKKSSLQSKNHEDSQPAIDEQTQTNLGINVRPKVQDDFRNLLLEFVINCLLDQPKDVVNYAADYFVELQERQHTIILRDYEESGESSKGASEASSTGAVSKRSADAKSASSTERELSTVPLEVDKLTDRATSIQQYG
ncbi:hypothetical protein D910_06912 [Dendroctonus ponderosae]